MISDFDSYINSKDGVEALCCLFENSNQEDFRVFEKNKDFVSKWKSYSETTLEEREKVNNRTIFLNEITLDIDKKKDESDSDFQKRINLIVQELKGKKIKFFLFKSGGEGIHIHIFLNRKDIIDLTDPDRKKIKQKIIEHFGGEISKANENSPIALEFSKHHRTKQKKELIEYNAGINSIDDFKDILCKDVDSTILNALSMPKKKYHSLGTGIHNEQLYFGTVLEINGQKQNAVITSTGEIFCNKIEIIGKSFIKVDVIRNDFGINYRYDLFDDTIDYTWSNDSIKRFLQRKESIVKIADIFKQLVDVNQKYIWHYDKRIHKFIACDIISNYFCPIFNAKGRILFVAEFESGKSKQSQIYQLASFNPLFAGNISPASFDRVIESTCGTIIIDNFDNMSEDLQKQIVQVIEVYYKKGSRNIKCDGKDNRPSAFNGYCPLVINNILGLKEVTESRCNKFFMLKTDNKEITDRKINVNDILWKELRDNLHVCALQNWKIVRDAYKNLDVLELSARDLERIEAVLTIAKIVGDDVYNEIINLVVEINSQNKIKEVSDSWEFILFEFINNELKDKSEITLKIVDITDAITDKIVESNSKPEIIKKEKLKFSHFAGKILSRTPLLKKKTINGYPQYNIKKEDFETLVKIKGYACYFNATNPINATNTTNTTNSINTTNTTNTTKQSVLVGLGVSVGSEMCHDTFTVRLSNITLVDYIRNNPQSTTQGITDHFKESKQENIILLLESLSQKGDIINNRNGFWSVA